MGAVVVCGRAKSAPGGAAAPRVRRGPLPRESSAPGPAALHRPLAGHLPPQARRRGRPRSPGTAHDPGMSSPVPAADRPPALRSCWWAWLAAAAPARAAADPVPVGVWPLQPDARGGRRVRPAGRALGLRPPRRRPARFPGTSGARGAGRHGVLRRGPRGSRRGRRRPRRHPDHLRARRGHRRRSARRVGRGGGHRPPAGRRLALSPAGVPALGLAARSDLPRPARPGRRRPGPAAAAVAGRAASRWPARW